MRKRENRQQQGAGDSEMGKVKDSERIKRRERMKKLKMKTKTVDQMKLPKTKRGVTNRKMWCLKGDRN